MSEFPPSAKDLRTPYEAVAVYYSASDSLEYVRRDCECVYRRIDELLTIVLEMQSRELVGFRLKGFRNFCLREFRSIGKNFETDFLSMVSILEKAATVAGDDVFEKKEREEAYSRVRKMAHEDNIALRDFPAA